jgi:hypothetical protein
MNNRNNRATRATRAIVASGSLLAIIFIGIPWVDEYLRLRRDAAELSELETQYAENQQRTKQLERIETKLTGELETLVARSVDPTKTESVREILIEIVRQAGGRIRRLEISEDETRIWAAENDDPRNDTMPLYAEESRFVLHTHLVELQADGSLESVRQILERVSSQGWLMTTKGLMTVPTSVRESPVNLELRFLLYGLGPNEHESEEDFAQLSARSQLR